MRGIPPQIKKALKALEVLDFQVKRAKLALEVAENGRRTQASVISALWKEHADWLASRLKKNRKEKS